MILTSTLTSKYYCELWDLSASVPSNVHDSITSLFSGIAVLHSVLYGCPPFHRHSVPSFFISFKSLHLSLRSFSWHSLKHITISHRNVFMSPSKAFLIFVTIASIIPLTMSISLFTLPISSCMMNLSSFSIRSLSILIAYFNILVWIIPKPLPHINPVPGYIFQSMIPGFPHTSSFLLEARYAISSDRNQGAKRSMEGCTH